MRPIIIAILVVLSSGCALCRPKLNPEERAAIFQREARDAREAKAKAEQRADNADKSIEALKKEKKTLLIKAENSEKDAREYRAEAAAKQKEINRERIERVQTTCYWMAGIAIFLALVAGAVSIWIPLVRRLALTFAVSAMSFAALAYFVAWLLPYLIWVGSILAGSGLLWTIIWWVRDHKTATQVIAAVETVKNGIPDYKTKFRQIIDPKIDKHVDRIRTRMGLKGKP